MKQVTITVEGHCYRNGEEAAVGKYSAIIEYKGHQKTLDGIESGSTSNAIVLRGTVDAIKALTQPCEIEVRTNSGYVVQTAESMHAYAKNGFCNKAGGQIANLSLWKELIAAGKNGKHHIKFVKA